MSSFNENKMINATGRVLTNIASFEANYSFDGYTESIIKNPLVRRNYFNGIVLGLIVGLSITGIGYYFLGIPFSETEMTFLASQFGIVGAVMFSNG